MIGTLGAWPEDVVEQAVRRNLVLIIGSGVSASCISPNGIHPPNWEELLRGLIDKLGLVDRKDEVEQLIAKSRLLDAAELIRQQARQLAKDNDFNKYVRVAVDGKPGDQYTGSAWHEAIVKLEPPVIVTTNYDKIIERATSNAYSSHDYKTEPAGDIRKGESTLLKIHGTVDKIDDIVVTRTDYTRLRLHGAQALEVLQALLLTRTALLLGYGLRDPDIQLLFENVLGGRNESPAHYMLTPDDLPDYERDILRYSFGVNAVTYPAGKHHEGLAMLEALAEEVQSVPPAP